ncbi:MAG TPA: aldolase/citrate lyase family protein [Jatrophihabitans sp.]|nr:aldolase/citrate lyase family protein [Jatrophihabitans sp.]
MIVYPCLQYTPVLRADSLLRSMPARSSMVVLDLEDSIPPHSKAAARSRLASDELADSGLPGVGLRINSINTPDGLRDIEALIGLDGRACGVAVQVVFVPKVATGSDVAIYRSLLAKISDAPEICTFIETVDAVENAFDIAAQSDGLCFGQADLVSEMYAPNEAYLELARVRLCTAAAKFGLPAIDSNSFELWDMDIVRAESEAAKRCGFTGKAAIHPKQVEPITQTFSVDPELLDSYRRTIKDYEENERGFAVTKDRVLAPPFVAKARRMIQLYDKAVDTIG